MFVNPNGFIFRRWAVRIYLKLAPRVLSILPTMRPSRPSLWKDGHVCTCEGKTSTGQSARFGTKDIKNSFALPRLGVESVQTHADCFHWITSAVRKWLNYVFFQRDPFRWLTLQCVCGWLVVGSCFVFVLCMCVCVCLFFLLLFFFGGVCTFTTHFCKEEVALVVLVTVLRKFNHTAYFLCILTFLL